MTDRDFSIDLIRQLQDAGHTALWAGGCVRDALLGRAPKDYDVATTATPEMVRDLFGHRRTLPIGAAFGVISVLPPKQLAGSLSPVEVATFRRDGGYSDGRRPDHVEYTDAREDALRRDFTINGMFFDPLSETVRDYVGGQEDLKAGVVRAIGDAADRIEEDKLRMLRGVRFAATFDFRLDADTLDAIQQRADQITVVSGERIGNELVRMLSHANKAIAAEWLAETGLLNHVLPSELRSDMQMNMQTVGDRGVAQLQRLENNHFEPAVVVLLEPALGDGHKPDVAKQYSTALQRSWRLTNDQRSAIAWIAGHWRTFHQADSIRWPQVQRLLIHRSASQAIDAAEAIAGMSGGLAFCRQRLAWPAEQLNPPLLLDGQALIKLGVQPGPAFKHVLDSVRDAQLNGDIDCPEAATQLAIKLLEQGI